MEPFQTVCFMDMYGRLNVMSSTQIVYHVRRIVSNALGIPKSKIRAFKPRIGGGFGAKQTAVSEVYPAFVTWKTGKPSKIVFTREESQIASSPRHDMAVTVRMGADKEGNIRAIDLYTLSNTGAYGEHGPTTVGLSGHKAIPLYGSLDAYRFVTMWSIPTGWQQELIVDMERRRESLRLRHLLTNWQKNLAWIRWRSV